MKKTTLRLCCLFVLSVVMSTTALHAQQSTRADFRFVVGDDMFFAAYRQNTENMKLLCDFIDNHREAIVSGVAPVRVCGYCATEGDAQARLARAKIRSNRVKSELILRKGLKEEHFKTSNSSHPYEGNNEIVIVSIIIPETDEPEPTVTVSEEHHEGQPAQTEQPENIEQAEQAEQAEQPAEESKVVETTPLTDNIAPQSNEVTAIVPTDARFSLRTNLLYWLGGMPNMGAEWKASQTTGIVLNGGYAPWASNSWSHNWAGWFIAPEVKFYFGEAKRLFAGVQFLAGGFNLKPADNGYIGHIFGGGVTGGYRLPISSSLDIDFSLGLGYGHLAYDTYRRADNGVNVYTGKGLVKNALVPVQAGVSLIWKIQ